MSFVTVWPLGQYAQYVLCGSIPFGSVDIAQDAESDLRGISVNWKGRYRMRGPGGVRGTDAFTAPVDTCLGMQLL